MFTLRCPICGRAYDIADVVKRNHVARGARISFMVCPDCATVSLCPADYHGIHREIVEEQTKLIVGGIGWQLVGHCVACQAQFEWREGKWRELVDPSVSAITALNDRLQRGDIDFDSYVTELGRLIELEG